MMIKLCVSRRSLAESKLAQTTPEQNSGHVAWICAVISTQGRRYCEEPGVVVDSQLLMSAHVATVCYGGYYQLRQLMPLMRCMTDEAIKTLTHAFISSRLDYCNVL